MTYVIPFKETPLQKEVRTDEARYKVAVWGRRSGKSTWLLNTSIRTCLEKAGAKVWIVAPTFSQAKDIYWRGSDMLGKYLLPWMYNKKNDSELLIEFKNGAILQFKGADRPETMRGSGLDLVGLDEVAEHRYSKETWETILSPSLSDRQGKAIFIGTPKGENFFKELYQRGFGNESNWKSWRIPTWESGAPWTLTDAGKAEIEEKRRTMNEDYFMQEYGAEFRRYTGLVFKNFDEKVHVQALPIVDRYKLEIGMDFGWTNPTTCLFTYFDDDDVWYIFDEHYEVEKPIREHAGLIIAKRNKYKNPLGAVFGDSASPQSIQEFGQHQWYVTPAVKGKDSILNGINRIQERLTVNPVTKKPRLVIHPRCENTIREFMTYEWEQRRKPGLNEKDTPVDANDHAIDALRYVILRHDIKTNKPKPSPIPYKYRPLGGYN